MKPYFPLFPSSRHWGQSGMVWLLTQLLGELFIWCYKSDLYLPFAGTFSFAGHGSQRGQKPPTPGQHPMDVLYPCPHFHSCSIILLTHYLRKCLEVHSGPFPFPCHGGNMEHACSTPPVPVSLCVCPGSFTQWRHTQLLETDLERSRLTKWLQGLPDHQSLQGSRICFGSHNCYVLGKSPILFRKSPMCAYIGLLLCKNIIIN